MGCFPFVIAGIYSQWLQGFRHPNDSIPPPVIADPVPYCEVRSKGQRSFAVHAT
jgi:hypothetical protein